MIYDMSSAIAVNEKIALAATGLAKSKNPGRMHKNVDSQTALSGVLVIEEI